MVFISLLHFNNGKSPVNTILTRNVKKFGCTRRIFITSETSLWFDEVKYIQRIDEYFTYRITLLIWDQRILFGKLW